ncbi:hypothetical protein SDC9_78633 [bioreactor metagenome]|uniref:Uncharacterized protein n=1 Tax=bioreactor metagenome TaxID=1076179 RepID=A0A644Z1L9_9ZZZZ
MDVRHQGQADLLFDGAYCFGRGQIRNGHPDNLTAGSGQTADLCHGGRYVVGTGIGHRLNGNRSAPANGNAPNDNLSGHTYPPVSFTMSLNATTIISKIKQANPAAFT